MSFEGKWFPFTAPALGKATKTHSQMYKYSENMAFVLLAFENFPKVINHYSMK